MAEPVKRKTEGGAVPPYLKNLPALRLGAFARVISRTRLRHLVHFRQGNSRCIVEPGDLRRVCTRRQRNQKSRIVGIIRKRERSHLRENSTQNRRPTPTCITR